MKMFEKLAVTILSFVLLTGCGAAENAAGTGSESSAAAASTQEVSTEIAASEETSVAVSEETAAAETTGPAIAATTETAASSESEAKTNGRLVCIDPGHTSVLSGKSVPLGPGSSQTKQGDTVGTHGNASGLSEYELTMNIARQLRSELEKRGYNVILTHEDTSTPIDCDARAQVANSAGADCLIRLHADGSDSSSASGAMAINITSSNPWNPQTYSESRRLSDDVLFEYVEATGLKSRGVLEEDNMTGNNWSQVPCTLIEMGFMTNPDEDLKMADPDFQTKMVQGLSNGIDKFFDRS